MKTLRMSRSTENRNAAKVIAFRGGTRRGASGLPEGHHVVSGRRLRRALESRLSRLQPYAIAEDGSLGRPVFGVPHNDNLGGRAVGSDIDPSTLAVRGRHLI